MDPQTDPNKHQGANQETNHPLQHHMKEWIGVNSMKLNKKNNIITILITFQKLIKTYK